ncbi:AEL_HP2_G0021250.mRNA.1.CDS.1 [Saccharomyces cerevisiae]|nr:AEL_HP2_G0021250.mRNA.1.CDS.1 [Saccharomyces cerevisiae]CAI6517210.1 AEL_HP2_G0021250.mRNA.1.CDS.1 [Saccharomyces cerevisiae]CAI6545061.1 AEL_HP1_G0022320.mRNA.1.CDS.1 [Saccharomyces cerevisiae]
MPSVCHTSPIEKIIQQGHRIQNDSLIPSKRTKLAHTELTAHYATEDSHVEKHFLHNGSNFDGIDNVRYQNQPSPLTFITPNNTVDSSDWVPQFSSMKIDDPLEFSSEYKRLYSNYESQQRLNSSRQHLPFKNCMIRKTSCTYPPQKTLRQQRQGNRDNPTDAFQFDAEFQVLEREIQKSGTSP